MKSNPCNLCGSSWHTAMGCPLKKRKGLNKIGRIGKLNQESTATWIANNPPDRNGQWDCYLRISPDCLGKVDQRTLNVEHKLSKVRRPDLRTDQSNLGSACSPCNKLKGSRDYTEFI